MDKREHEDHPDTELVDLLINGDRDAFEAIYRRYAAALFRYAHRSIGDREECREVLQDVFESLWVRHSSLRIDSLKPYLYTMVRYRMIRYFRRAKQLRNYADHYEVFSAVHDSLGEGSRDPEAIRDLILQSLEGLSDRCRTAFQLRLVENLSNGEIAERMNISKGTVELYMVKAFHHLRAHRGLKNAL